MPGSYRILEPVASEEFDLELVVNRCRGDCSCCHSDIGDTSIRENVQRSSKLIVLLFV